MGNKTATKIRIKSARREVDPKDYPYCKVCEELIPRENDDIWKWLRRQTCRKKKNDICWREYTKTTRERTDGPKSNPHRKKKSEPSRFQKSVVGDPRDEAQRLLNMQIDKDVASRRGHVKSKVKIYTKEEIAAVEAQYSSNQQRKTTFTGLSY